MSSRIPLFFAKFCHFPLDKVVAVIGDDAVRVAVPVDELAEELGSGLPVALLDGFGLDPLGELVDCDKQMGEARWSSLELAHHVESPDRKGPGDGDRLQRRAGEVSLVCIFLAPHALLDNCGRVGVCSEPVKAGTERLGD